MRSQSLVAALSLGSTALALHSQFPVNTAGETGVRPLDIVNLNSFSSNPEQWNFDEGPAKNATGNLIFDTVNSFLQHWPNTRYRNGHNIVPGVIPIGTLLYHGTSRDTIPSEPEWVATDPEHSIIFARHNARSGGGWHLTLAATRPLKVLYFDGSSAAKVTDGTMDVQFIVASIPEQASDRDVIKALWTRGFEAMHAGSWRNRYPGDSRIVLDLTGLISLYDTALAPSLVPVRAGLERCDHRVHGLSSEDISRLMRKLTEVVSRPDPVGSGINWKTLIHVIVDRYADRLELMQHLLNFTSSDSQELLQRGKLAQAQLRIMLTPYLLHSIAVPSAGTSGVNASRWASPVFRHCATTHTSQMINQKPSMTSSEHLLLKAVEDTTREICRVTTKMWADGVMSGLDTLFQVEMNEEGEVTRLMGEWRQDMQKLMSWLDWSVWIKCRPACGPEEMCYLPTWPIGAPRLCNSPPPPRYPQNATDAPEAKCFVDRVGPPPEGQSVSDALFSFPAPVEDWRKPQPNRGSRSVLLLDKSVYDTTPDELNVRYINYVSADVPRLITLGYGYSLSL
ncbi:hypothetical protein DFH29DRAFT_879174 [Suillus ampliporus]|nr:hypothetical protein DFH29DRAFT_879174 [Suillus ampliporus]